MRTVVEDLMQTERFRDRFEALCEELDAPRSAIEQGTVEALEHMIARHEPLAMAAWKRLGGLMSRRCRIEVDDRTLAGLREIDREHSIAWLPSHRSYIDTFLLEEVVQGAGIQPAYVLGGDNIDFWPIGSLMRRAGTLFIRRSTHGDPVYRFALRSYIAHLVEQGHNLTWSIEGGRTRTGKMRPPRYGALRYVVDAARASEGPDVMVVPVAVIYDQLAEVATMTAEALGADKRSEGIAWLIEYLRRQQTLRNKAQIAFGEPFLMRERIEQLEDDPQVEGHEIERLGLEVCYRINRVTPAIPTAIVTLALLAAERALTLTQTIAQMAPILHYLREHPTTPTTLGAQLQNPGWVRASLDQLTDSGVLERFTGGDETIWQIAPDQHLVAAFYRNTLIHLLIVRAIAELALFRALEDSSVDLRESIWNQAVDLRQLLKFDFFFANRSQFLEELRAEVAQFDPEWNVDEPELTRERVESWLERSKPHLAHLVLRPFFDAYLVVAEQLRRWPHDREVDQKRLLDRCLGYGQQQVRQRVLHSPESVTLELFRSALKLAAQLGLLLGKGRDVYGQRKAFAEQMRTIVGHLDALGRIQREPIAAT